MYLTPNAAKTYIQRQLSGNGIIPAEKVSRWNIRVQQTLAYSAKQHPATHQIYVYAWPISSEADIEPLIETLQELNGVVDGQRWPDKTRLRPGVRIWLSREITTTRKS